MILLERLCLYKITHFGAAAESIRSTPLKINILNPKSTQLKRKNHPLKAGSQKERLVFQPSIFRCKLAVSFRECHFPGCNQQNTGHYITNPNNSYSREIPQNCHRFLFLIPPRWVTNDPSLWNHQAPPKHRTQHFEPHLLVHDDLDALSYPWCFLWETWCVISSDFTQTFGWTSVDPTNIHQILFTFIQGLGPESPKRPQSLKGHLWEIPARCVSLWFTDWTENQWILELAPCQQKKKRHETTVAHGNEVQVMTVSYRSWLMGDILRTHERMYHDLVYSCINLHTPS